MGQRNDSNLTPYEEWETVSYDFSTSKGTA